MYFTWKPVYSISYVDTLMPALCLSNWVNVSVYSVTLGRMYCCTVHNAYGSYVQQYGGGSRSNTNLVLYHSVCKVFLFTFYFWFLFFVLCDLILDRERGSRYRWICKVLFSCWRDANDWRHTCTIHHTLYTNSQDLYWPTFAQAHTHSVKNTKKK